MATAASLGAKSVNFPSNTSQASSSSLATGSAGTAGARQQFTAMDQQMKSRQGNPTMIEMALEAIVNCKEPKGVSVIGIKNYILLKYPTVDARTLKSRLKKALVKCLEQGSIKRPGAASAAPPAIMTGRYKTDKNNKKSAKEKKQAATSKSATQKKQPGVAAKFAKKLSLSSSLSSSSSKDGSGSESDNDGSSGMSEYTLSGSSDSDQGASNSSSNIPKQRSIAKKSSAPKEKAQTSKKAAGEKLQNGTAKSKKSNQGGKMEKKKRVSSVGKSPAVRRKTTVVRKAGVSRNLQLRQRKQKHSYRKGQSHRQLIQ